MYTNPFCDSDIKHRVKNVVHGSKTTEFYIPAYFLQSC